MDTGIGKGILEISMALISVALIALLVGHASDTAQLVGASANAFNSLLKTVTLRD